MMERQERNDYSYENKGLDLEAGVISVEEAGEIPVIPEENELNIDNRVIPPKQSYSV